MAINTAKGVLQILTSPTSAGLSSDSSGSGDSSVQSTPGVKPREEGLFGIYQGYYKPQTRNDEISRVPVKDDLDYLVKRTMVIRPGNKKIEIAPNVMVNEPDRYIAIFKTKKGYPHAIVINATPGRYICKCDGMEYSSFQEILSRYDADVVPRSSNKSAFSFDHIKRKPEDDSKRASPLLLPSPPRAMHPDQSSIGGSRSYAVRRPSVDPQPPIVLKTENQEILERSLAAKSVALVEDPRWYCGDRAASQMLETNMIQHKAKSFAIFATGDHQFPYRLVSYIGGKKFKDIHFQVKGEDIQTQDNITIAFDTLLFSSGLNEECSIQTILQKENSAGSSVPSNLNPSATPFKPAYERDLRAIRTRRLTVGPLYKQTPAKAANEVVIDIDPESKEKTSSS